MPRAGNPKVFEKIAKETRAAAKKAEKCQETQSLDRVPINWFTKVVMSISSKDKAPEPEQKFVKPSELDLGPSIVRLGGSSIGFAQPPRIIEAGSTPKVDTSEAENPDKPA